MVVDWQLATEIAAPTLALFVGAGLDRWLERKPKLVTYYGHVSSFTLQNQNPGQSNIALHTHSVVIRNTGKRAAENVRIAHNVLPPNVQIFPAMESRTVNLPGGGGEIIIPRLIPDEQITISYLYFPPLLWNQINTNVRSDSGFAKVLHVLPTPQLSKSVIRILWGLIVLGSITLIYLLIKTGIWFYRR